MTYQAYSVPQNASLISSNSNSSFILLNTEIQNDTYLFGFDIYAIKNGTKTIEGTEATVVFENIKVVISNDMEARVVTVITQ